MQHKTNKFVRSEMRECFQQAKNSISHSEGERIVKWLLESALLKSVDIRTVRGDINVAVLACRKSRVAERVIQPYDLTAKRPFVHAFTSVEDTTLLRRYFDDRIILRNFSRSFIIKHCGRTVVFFTRAIISLVYLFRQYYTIITLTFRKTRVNNRKAGREEARYTK